MIRLISCHFIIFYNKISSDYSTHGKEFISTWLKSKQMKRVAFEYWMKRRQDRWNQHRNFHFSRLQSGHMEGRWRGMQWLIKTNKPAIRTGERGDWKGNGRRQPAAPQWKVDEWPPPDWLIATRKSSRFKEQVVVNKAVASLSRPREQIERRETRIGSQFIAPPPLQRHLGAPPFKTRQSIPSTHLTHSDQSAGQFNPYFLKILFFDVFYRFILDLAGATHTLTHTRMALYLFAPLDKMSFVIRNCSSTSSPPPPSPPLPSSFKPSCTIRTLDGAAIVSGWNHGSITAVIDGGFNFNLVSYLLLFII